MTLCEGMHFLTENIMSHQLEIFDSTRIQDNKATGFFGGGAVYTAGYLLVTGYVQVLNNTAQSGAAIFGNASTIRVRGFARFAENVAADSGGAIYMAQGTFTSVLGGQKDAYGGIEFVRNYAGNYGGAVFAVGERSRLELSSSVTFADNRAALTGGAIVAGGATSVIMRAESERMRSGTRAVVIHESVPLNESATCHYAYACVISYFYNCMYSQQ
jgi:predicted outer membrane repeat protein